MIRVAEKLARLRFDFFIRLERDGGATRCVRLSLRIDMGRLWARLRSRSFAGSGIYFVDGIYRCVPLTRVMGASRGGQQAR